MRIRSIKPEFWRSDDIARLSVKDAYCGNVLRPCGFDKAVPPEIYVRYVYFIFAGSELRYIGQTWHIRDRIEKHASKWWFVGCDHIEAVSVYDQDEFILQKKSDLLEKRSIKEFLPTGNIVGPDILPGRIKWKESTRCLDADM